MDDSDTIVLVNSREKVEMVDLKSDFGLIYWLEWNHSSQKEPRKWNNKFVLERLLDGGGFKVSGRVWAIDVGTVRTGATELIK